MNPSERSGQAATPPLRRAGGSSGWAWQLGQRPGARSGCHREPSGPNCAIGIAASPSRRAPPNTRPRSRQHDAGLRPSRACPPGSTATAAASGGSGPARPAHQVGASWCRPMRVCPCRPHAHCAQHPAPLHAPPCREALAPLRPAAPLLRRRCRPAPAAATPVLAAATGAAVPAPPPAAPSWPVRAEGVGCVGC